MGEQSPHLLAITSVGCLLVVSTLAVAAVTSSLVVVGLAFLALILVTALLTEAVSRTVGERTGKPPSGGQERKES